MKKDSSANGRRGFLKTAAIGVAGAAISSNMPKAFAGTAAFKAINPEIPNTRVVCCYDTGMLTGTGGSEFLSQNKVVNTARVQANLDSMAMSLSQKSNANDAWKTIFRSSKPWASTKVAFKVNCINTLMMHHIASIDKICKVLNGFGVPYANMIVYDGCHNANGKYNTYVGTASPETGYTGAKLSAGVVISNGNVSLGGTTSFALTGHGSPSVTKNLVDGTIDILVNCAVNKGHSDWNGNCTLAMKNHYGTFDPNGGSNTHGSMDYILAINKSDPIVGGTIPRQQLIIVDSLWGAKTGPNAGPDATPYHRLIMGTFAPVVDYFVAKKIRSEVMGQTYSATSTQGKAQARFISDFSYAETDLSWIVLGATGIPSQQTQYSQPIKTNFEVKSGNFKSLKLDLHNMDSQVEVNILDIQGKMIKNMGAHKSKLVWDGRNQFDELVPSGTYILQFTNSMRKESVSFNLLRI